MQKPDRDTIYTGVLLAAGLPPKPRDYTTTFFKTTIIDYSIAHKDWTILAEHMLYTALREWILWSTPNTFAQLTQWKKEKEQFMCWIAERLLEQKEAGNG